jgi:secondary thiamine-phosphate synthase enzyme
MWLQKEIRLQPKSRGVHLVTAEVMKQMAEIKQIEIGQLHLFIKHTSASLALNENADPDVRTDLEAYFNYLAPENSPYFKHTLEGSDDMPAHIKSVLVGSSLILPIFKGRLNIGVWQGIYLCEHRNRASGRTLVITIHGQRGSDD